MAIPSLNPSDSDHGFIAAAALVLAFSLLMWVLLPAERVKMPTAGTPCTIFGAPDATGIYDDMGNCMVPFRYTRPDEVWRVP